MITATVRMMSKALGRHVAYSIIVPEPTNAGPGPYPVLYQLHGRSDDHTAWLTNSNLIRHASKFPILIVCPDGGLSYWMNSSTTDRVEDFLIEELPAHLENTFQVRKGQAAIGGLSMGGFGAVRLALKYPERFASVWSHSSAFWGKEELPDRVGPHGRAKDADIYRLAEDCQGQNLPVISFDCGTDDFLLEHNRRFHNHLKQLGIAHTYREHPGSHTWDYWDAHVRSALVQHVKALGVRVPPSMS